MVAVARVIDQSPPPGASAGAIDTQHLSRMTLGEHSLQREVLALFDRQVDILLPAKGNLRFVEWAANAQLSQIVRWGCRVHRSPPPFDHSKLMIVDAHWVLLGSANWDARSLRLNFELNVECYGREFAQEMQRVIEHKLSGAREVTLAEVDGRSYPAKLRDATARLFSPYL